MTLPAGQTPREARPNRGTPELLVPVRICEQRSRVGRLSHRETVGLDE